MEEQRLDLRVVAAQQHLLQPGIKLAAIEPTRHDPGMNGEPATPENRTSTGRPTGLSSASSVCSKLSSAAPSGSPLPEKRFTPPQPCPPRDRVRPRRRGGGRSRARPSLPALAPASHALPAPARA